jgi:DNA-directed RNA polymerase specialized sigma24 family protein
LDITQDSFYALLTWLDSNLEAAAQKYEAIRSGLIKIFISHGFNDAEDLTDLTINRVINKLPDIEENYVGEPVRYFHGVARNIIHEARRRKEIATERMPESLIQITITSDRYDCLLNCLGLLSVEKRDLILDYYLYDGRDKIAHHKSMAEQLGLTDGALRTRAHHIRVALEKCVLNCAKKLAAKQKGAWRALLKRRQIFANQEH